ncbi:TetR/AcrR family transcriptional regulator [Nocardia vermiculata]|uniref:TetR/AcrR family transcriptional regulator n=1 Tax=Nocardia vermiculata TaxID=257274 RepID=A0A846Y363_9NOCA|nr:helix-turn-helix domain-containing protein [Nocardia vermiculata]NKY51069.1 TetR/AcrR family transcriptional regulator [Nocardia vermiculata]
MTNRPAANTPRDSRSRLVAGAAEMIRRRGLSATSVRDLAKYAHAPLGSTYHHFPGGKSEVATEAVAFAGEMISDALARALQRGPVDGLRSFLTEWRGNILDSEFRAGCPVLAVAIEDVPDAEGAPRAAAAIAFARWTDLLAASLREHGADPVTAENTATLIIAAFEGSLAMCRAERSTAPLDRIGAQLDTLVSAAIAPHRDHPIPPPEGETLP